MSRRICYTTYIRGELANQYIDIVLQCDLAICQNELVHFRPFCLDGKGSSAHAWVHLDERRTFRRALDLSLDWVALEQKVAVDFNLHHNLFLLHFTATGTRQCFLCTIALATENDRFGVYKCAECELLIFFHGNNPVHLKAREYCQDTSSCKKLRISIGWQMLHNRVTHHVRGLMSFVNCVKVTIVAVHYAHWLHHFFFRITLTDIWYLLQPAFVAGALVVKGYPLHSINLSPHFLLCVEMRWLWQLQYTMESQDTLDAPGTSTIRQTWKNEEKNATSTIMERHPSSPCRWCPPQPSTSSGRSEMTWR